MSLSKLGRISLAYSSMVTVLPKLRKMEATSSPMTPAPMIHSFWGIWSMSSISVEVSTPGRSQPSIGGLLAVEPVAMSMCSAVYFSPDSDITVCASNSSARSGM